MSQQHPETPATGLRARQPTANPPGHKLWRETKPRYKGDAHICCLRLGSASLQLVWGVRGPQRWTVGGTESQLFAGIRGMSLSRVMGAEQGEPGLGVGGRAGRRARLATEGVLCQQLGLQWGFWDGCTPTGKDTKSYRNGCFFS